MAKKFKYVNKSNFPIFLPDSRGGQVMFRTGEGTTKQWFSRFTGKRQLTAEPISDKEAKASQQILDIKNAKVNLTPPPPAKKPDVPAEVETDEYTVEKGIYTCKLCKGTFRTGSIQSMVAHIKDFHGVRDTDNTTQVMSSRQSGTEAAIKNEAVSKPTPTVTSTPKPAAPSALAAPEKTEAPSQEGDTYDCAFPGCGKSFASKRGLNMHNVRMHS